MSVLAASVAYLIGRFVALERVGRHVVGYPRFAASDDAIANDGFTIVTLLRLSRPLPFGAAWGAWMRREVSPHVRRLFTTFLGWRR